MFRKVLILMLFFFGLGNVFLVRGQEKVVVRLFGAETCPHCSAEKIYLASLVDKYDWLSVEYVEITEKEGANELAEVARGLGVEVKAVPFTVVCGEYFSGFGEGEEFKKELEERLVEYYEVGCGGAVTPEKKIDAPILGELEIAKLSLPVLTLVIAALDGFNPCAMWVLMFLIGILLGMKERVRMWILGGTFILTSGFVYFLFLAGWLNFYLFLGLTVWMRFLIGLVALGAGAYYLRDYWLNKTGACKVTGGGKRRLVFEEIKILAGKKNFLVALVGIIVLAVVVNLVELVCSAGLPAVYTQVLTMTALPTWQYYLYLVFYVSVFMIDDVVVFVGAMVTLRANGMQGKYSRYSHFVGGILMIAIGLLMILAPEILAFG